MSASVDLAASTSAATTPPLGKYLASTDKRTRDKAIKHLLAFLSSPQTSLSNSDLAKLWKGIFYCFWMSDKPLVQQALASELAELLLTITTTSASITFLRGFWESTVREWNGIDRLRIDKYYMLVRRFVNATFRLLIRTEWDLGACQDYNNILAGQGGPLSPSDIRVPTSLTYHLADIYVEELEKALGATPSPLPAPLLTLLMPFFSLAAQTPNKITYERLQSGLIRPLFRALSNQVRPDAEPRDDYSNLIFNACYEKPLTEGPARPAVLKKKLLRALFEIASRQDTRDSNRRKLYAIWQEGEDADE
ncbi:hypothetical protein AX17_000860 [Amanita inopinata Kibby_2008]|nr:hypothetical protein AX17_000860 [Amanita inopinata Kibby_2008]